MMNPPMPGVSQDASLSTGSLYGQDVGIPPVLPNFLPSEDEQREIVSKCLQFKEGAQKYASTKKEKMRTAYAYMRGRFVGNDLLPTPSSIGSDKDNNKNRPQVFIPLSRQQFKTIFSQLKMNLFPNDEDYFRVRAKGSNGIPYEDNLTEGLKYVFKESNISEKLGGSLSNLIWSGIFSTYPTIKEEKIYEWSFQKGVKDPTTDQQIVPDVYIPKQLPSQSKIDIQNFNPLNFYIDPMVEDPEQAKWVYTTNKKTREIEDSNLYVNKDKLKSIKTKDVLRYDPRRGNDLSGLIDQQSQFDDIEGNVSYDFFYFPCLETSTALYRNYIVGIAGEQVLVRFHPNTYPRGLNPTVFCNWMFDPEDPYSIGPIEDLIDIQKTINIMWNYKLEVMARAGNRFAVTSTVDLTNFFGVAGGVCVTEDPTRDIVNFSGDYREIAVIDNSIGVLKAEAQLVSGSQNPFQGSSQVDYQKTATELQIVQEQSISILREVIEHVGVMGIQRVMERLMYLVADMYDGPIEIPRKTMDGKRVFETVDFSILKSGQFTIELIGINPSQSKQAQINGLMRLWELVGSNAESLLIGEPVLEKIGDLLGIKNIRDLLEQIKQRIQTLAQQQQQASMGTAGEPDLEGVSSPPATG